MNALDNMAKVSPKDCFVDGETVVFLVPEKGMRQAIGKNGQTVELMKKKLGKKIELFEYAEEPEKFLEKAFFRAKIEKVEIKETAERKIAVIHADPENKRIMLQNMGRLRKVKELAKRNYGLEEVRIR